MNKQIGQQKGEKMNDLISVSMLIKAIDEEAPDVIADYGEYYGSESGFSREKLIEIISRTPRIELAANSMG